MIAKITYPCKMFNTLGIEAILCTVRRGSFSILFQKLLNLSEFPICLDCSIQLLQKGKKSF